MKEKVKSFFGWVSVLISAYAVIGGWSFVAIINGADILYIPFWHAPWKLLLSLFS